MKKTDTPEILLPPRLKRGDTFGLVAPAGPVENKEGFTAGVKLLRDMGFRVMYSNEILEKDGYLAGPDHHRAEQFMNVWLNPDVKAVMALRGGYGSLRLVPHLDMEMVRRFPKIFIGFSDITVLHTAILKHTGLVTFHGPVATTVAKGDREMVEYFFNTLTDSKAESIKPAGLEVLTSGNAKGRLLGGNLTNLAHLIATPYEISWENAILFLEDVNEPPYRIDRMFTHLQEAGRLQGIAGLILGNFKDCEDVEKIWQRVLELVSGQGIPVWSNFPVGHGQGNYLLPMGVEVEMDSHGGVLRFLEPCTRDI